MVIVIVERQEIAEIDGRDADALREGALVARRAQQAVQDGDVHLAMQLCLDEVRDEAHRLPPFSSPGQK